MVILHRPPHHRQSKARAAAPHFLLGIERLENVVEVLGTDALAAVLDPQQDIFPLVDRVVSPNRVVQKPAFRGDLDKPPRRLGFRRVGNEVHEGFLQMDGRAFDIEQMRIEPEIDPGARVMGHDLLMFRRGPVGVDDGVQVKRLLGHDSPSGQGQQVLHNRRRLLP